MYREIFIQAGLKFLKIWWPSLLFISVALVYLYFEERRDKYNSNYKPFATQRRR